MGLIPSRARAENYEDEGSFHTLKYPPKNGSFFGPHFLMGGERFEIQQPEAFLFGENNDLNFLGCKPVQHANSGHATSEPLKTLQSLVNVRRDSIKFVAIRKSKDMCDEQIEVSNDVKITSEIAKVENKTSADDSNVTCTLSTSDSVNEDQSINEMPNSATVNTLNTGTESKVNEICRYNIEFTFDCDVPCHIQIFYFAIEIASHQGLRYMSTVPQMNSPVYNYPIGAAQLFSQPTHCFEPSLFNQDELLYNYDTEVIPIVVHCVALNDQHDGENTSQSHSTLAAVDRSAEGHGYIIKPLKQKLFANGICYLLQEIYGIENKFNPSAVNGQAYDEHLADSNAECVICMSELRDTLILPCRHLCLCYSCAETLRYKATNCPICRSPFRALLQFKAVRRTLRSTVPLISSSSETSLNPLLSHSSSIATNSDMATTILMRYSYDTLSIFEALNGPVELHRSGSLPRGLVSQMGSQSSHVATSDALGSVSNSSSRSSIMNAGHRKAKKKKTGRVVSPIQEVLTPSVIGAGVESQTPSLLTKVLSSPVNLCAQSAEKVDEFANDAAVNLHHHSQPSLQQVDLNDVDGSLHSDVARINSIVIEDEDALVGIESSQSSDFDYKMYRREAAEKLGQADRKFCSNLKEEVILSDANPPQLASSAAFGNSCKSSSFNLKHSSHSEPTMLRCGANVDIVDGNQYSLTVDELNQSSSSNPFSNQPKELSVSIVGECCDDEDDDEWLAASATDEEVSTSEALRSESHISDADAVDGHNLSSTSHLLDGMQLVVPPAASTLLLKDRSATPLSNASVSSVNSCKPLLATYNATERRDHSTTAQTKASNIGSGFDDQNVNE